MIKLKPKQYVAAGILIVLLGALGLYVGFGNALGGNTCGIKDLPQLLRTGPIEFVNGGWCGDPVIIEGVGRSLNYFLSIILDLFMWLIPVGLFLIVIGVAKARKRQG